MTEPATAIDGAPTASSEHSEAPPARQRVKLQPLLALKPYLLRNKATLILAGIALVLAASATLAIPVAVRRMIDFGFTGDNGSFIARYFGMMIVIGGVLAVASSARFYFVSWIGERVVADLRADVFGHLTKLGPAFFDQTHSGEIMSRLTSDTTQIKAAASSAFSQTVRAIIMITGALTMMVVTSATLSLVVIAAIPLILIPIILFGRLVRQRSRQAQDSLAQSSALAAENLGAIRTLQAFTSEAVISARFAAAVETAFDDARSRLVARALMTAMVMFLVVGSIVGVLWFGASMVIEGTLSAGRLGQFILYSVFAAGSLAQLSEVWGEVQQAAGSAERLVELLETKPMIQGPQHPVRMPEPGQGRISFEGVTLAYPSRPDQPVLQDVSFAAEPGELIALVGPSGAGKTSVFNLIARFYDPLSGRVEMDGLDVRDVDPIELRKRLALVPQEISLFADTIAENIRYGDDAATDEAVRDAAKAANAHAFIEALPDGYATMLGERGVTLSGGQRQRVAIARAILRNPPILLLDEATSALDAESEHAVQAALEQVMKGRTTFVITHRLATIRQADRILVLEDGRLVEQGTHETLTADGGLYTRLAELQFTARAAE
ncbi:MAG: ATP-binding cassette subfamily B protein [Alphaproteobacteria bacterium]|jgi:ATP-binding cassette subfamily B protein